MNRATRLGVGADFIDSRVWGEKFLENGVWRGFQFSLEMLESGANTFGIEVVPQATINCILMSFF